MDEVEHNEIKHLNTQRFRVKGCQADNSQYMRTTLILSNARWAELSGKISYWTLLMYLFLNFPEIIKRGDQIEWTSSVRFFFSIPVRRVSVLHPYDSVQANHVAWLLGTLKNALFAQPLWDLRLQKGEGGWKGNLWSRPSTGTIRLRYYHYYSLVVGVVSLFDAAILHYHESVCAHEATKLSLAWRPLSWDIPCLHRNPNQILFL